MEILKLLAVGIISACLISFTGFGILTAAVIFSNKIQKLINRKVK